MLAPFYSSVSLDRLVVGKPREPRDKANGVWVHGNLNLVRPDGVTQELVVTGPRMRVVYSGCRWNRLVFAASMEDSATRDFVTWMRTLANGVHDAIWLNPEKYRPGSKTNSRFTFDFDIAKPSSDPSLYPDEIRTRLATRWTDNGGEDLVALPKSVFHQTVDGEQVVVDPANIAAGSFIIPVIKLSYFRNGDRFGLVMTVLKGMYFPPENSSSMDVDYEIDIENAMV